MHEVAKSTASTLTEIPINEYVSNKFLSLLEDGVSQPVVHSLTRSLVRKGT
jgi:hypothetical protein